ncbi:MAG TPA: hypothetical protein VLB46_16680, partial [Pyrinomonadaceae bacterium]|nr:hypothetical protein [Pyrinomonadaceae bacterium]
DGITEVSNTPLRELIKQEEIRVLAVESANGAKYKSPGQARSASPWVTREHPERGLKGRNTQAITPLQGWNVLIVCYQGRRASRLPLAIIFRAVGASGQCEAHRLHFENLI